MTWDALGAIAEALGAIAVFGTLMYLSVQMRQVKSELHSSSLREASRMANDLNNAMISSPDLCRALVKVREGEQALEQWEWVMLDCHFRNNLNVWEVILEQLEVGVLDAPRSSVMNALKHNLSEKWMRTAWERNKGGYPSNFQRVVEPLIRAGV